VREGDLRGFTPRGSPVKGVSIGGAKPLILYTIQRLCIQMPLILCSVLHTKAVHQSRRGTVGLTPPLLALSCRRVSERRRRAVPFPEELVELVLGTIRIELAL
jgi:hypothetical protein